MNLYSEVISVLFCRSPFALVPRSLGVTNNYPSFLPPCIPSLSQSLFFLFLFSSLSPALLHFLPQLLFLFMYLLHILNLTNECFQTVLLFSNIPGKYWLLPLPVDKMADC